MKNRLRELIKQNKPSLGTRILSVWPGVIELLGQTGTFDYVEFVAEYSPWTLPDLDNIARTAELYDISSMIKIDAIPRSYIASKALSSGIQNFLFADIRTVEDAEEAVKSVRNEPKGIMGIGSYRAAGYVFTKFSVSDYRNACQDAVIAIMIEKKSAVEHLEEILSIDEIDFVQFGPSDYGLSIGLTGEPGSTWGFNNEKVKEAELKTIKTALKMGKHPRVELQTLDSIQQYIDLGVTDFSIGTDIRVLYNYWREEGDEFRKLFSDLGKP